MNDAPRSVFRLLINRRVLAVPALLLALAAPAAADKSAPANPAPIADAADKPTSNDDPLEGINIDEPMGKNDKSKKGRKPATPPAKQGKGGTKTS